MLGNPNLTDYNSSIVYVCCPLPKRLLCWRLHQWGHLRKINLCLHRCRDAIWNPVCKREYSHRGRSPLGCWHTDWQSFHAAQPRLHQGSPVGW